MSDDTQNVGEYATELSELQETATTARTTADQLKAALTDQSSDDDRKAAEAAETTAVEAEKSFADAKAKADTEAAAKAEAEAAAQAEKDAQGSGDQAPDANESRTGFVEKGNPGEQCICPDGRKGTVHKFDNGLICIPNADQG